MERIIAASKNRHKIEEIEKITARAWLRVVSRADAGVPDDLEVVEDGLTFEENSRKKAETIMRVTGEPAIADDSGLMVDALDGRPGVFSARFAGEEADDEANNDKLLALLAGVPAEERGARFVSVITLVWPDGRVLTARGECPGRILMERRGKGGFGYDPLFLPDGCSETFAELSADAKNRISHRARALEELARLLREAGSRDAGGPKKEPGR